MQVQFNIFLNAIICIPPRKENKNILDIDISIVISEKVRHAIQKSRFTQDVIAGWCGIPLRTFADKIAGNTAWKVDEVAHIAIFLEITLDELVFGERNYVKKFNDFYKAETKKKVKEFLEKKKDYKTIGKLYSEGYFKEKDKSK